MLRHRTLAAAPARDTSDTWRALGGLVTNSLERSSQIEAADVEQALEAAAGVGRILIAGGHLETHPFTVIAGTMHLRITTCSGVAATSLEENLNPVPGCAGATEWTIYIPSVEPLGSLVQSAAAEHPNLSAAEPPTDELTTESSAAKRTTFLDEDALRAWAEEEP